MVETILKAKLIDDVQELDTLANEALSRLLRAFHVQDDLLCEKEVAARFSFLTLTKLRKMRCAGKGPKYIKFGKTKNSRVYYRVSDIESWIVDNYQLEPFFKTRLDA